MLAREVIQRVREIQIRTGRQVADVLAGQYVSVFKGRGIEFDEVRPYIPGDDVRTIDWNVTARMGAPFVKRYVEERQLTLMLMADVSASQDFGSGKRSKREAATELCALLAFSATRNDDKVGLTLFHGGIELYIPPRKGQRHALRVVREVLTHGEEFSSGPGVGLRSRWFRRAKRPRYPRQATQIADAIEFLMTVTKRRAVCFIVSDFLDERYLPALEAANRKHDVIAVLVSDPREWELAPAGLMQLRDPESGEMRLVDTGSARVRQAFAARSLRRLEELRATFQAARIDFLHVDISKSVVEPLVKFFRMRERRSRR
jgi:uncharacterized protein (DUF58 family)